MKIENSKSSNAKNIFVLCAGRCGSKTFIKACEHITNYSSAHESRVSKLGDDRLNYPLYHIEADNRLSWFLGRLDNKYRDDAVYVHLHRDSQKIAESYNRRWPYPGTIVRAFANGILMSKELSINPCIDYVRTVSENVTHFLRDKTQVFHVNIDSPKESFSEFWDYIKAEGDKDAALQVFDVVHNPSFIEDESDDVESSAGDVVASLERVIRLSYEERKQAFSMLSKKDIQLRKQYTRVSELEHEISGDKKSMESLEGQLSSLEGQLNDVRNEVVCRDESISKLTSLNELLEERNVNTLAEASESNQSAIASQARVAETAKKIAILAKEAKALDQFNARLLVDHEQLITDFNKSNLLAEELKGSRSYRLGHSVMKNLKSPLGWLRIPVDLVRAIKPKKISAPVMAAAPPKPVLSKAIGELDAFVKEKPNRVVLKAAEIARHSIDDALEFIELNGNSRDLHSFNILKANNSLLTDSGELDWLKYVNMYLSQYRIAGLSLMNGQGSLFSRLESKVDYTISDPVMVSVIMPAFNAKETIRHAANSILNQTWKNIELIIVDDKSNDGTWEVIQEIASNDSRVIALTNPVNVGPYVSKNRALKLVRGQYFTGQDADDWSHPQRIELQLQGLRSQNGAKAGVSYMLRTTPAGKVTQLMAIGATSYDGVARLSSISCIFETDFFKQRLGSWDSVRFGADSELIGRAKAILGDDLYNHQLITMVCQDVEGSLTNDPTTGVRVNGQGLSPVRKAYRSAWTEWHQELSQSGSADTALPLGGANRRFSAPKEMQVPNKDLDIIYAD